MTTFHPDGNADQTPHTTDIIITDDELREIGWLRDTKNLNKQGWEDKYLAALSVSGLQVDSADEAGISVRYVKKRIKEDAIFAELHEQALARSQARMEDLALTLALHGVPTTYKRKDGTVVTENRVDTRFLEFYLDRKIPGFKADKKDLQQLGENGLTINFTIGDGAPVKADLELPAEETP